MQGGFGLEVPQFFQAVVRKQSTNPPTKALNRPSAIQPAVFKQSDGGIGYGFIVDDEADRMFGEFWAAYPERCPRKTDKASCRQKYLELLAAASDGSALHAKLLDSLRMWDESEMWNKEDGKFIRAPLKWLEKRSWEDSPAPDRAHAAKKAEESRTYDWSLCEERCANCGLNGCSEGVKVPPNHGAWAVPPEDCAHFRAAG